MKKFVRVSAFMFAIVLTGCMSFTYDGQKFGTEQEALAYQDKRQGEGVQSIQPASSKIGGILKIYVPNDVVTRDRMMTGNKQGAAGDYILKVLRADQRKLKEAFERRGSFDAVELIFTIGQHEVPVAGHHVMYFYSESVTVGSWYYIGTKVPRTPVTYDRGTSNMGERYKFLIESVESLAQAEKIASKR